MAAGLKPRPSRGKLPAARENQAEPSTPPAARLIDSPNSETACAREVASGRRALASSPGQAHLELDLARALASCQRYPEAIARYRHWLDADPRAENALLELGDTLRRATRDDEAVRVFRQALTREPSNSAAALGLARTLALTGQYPEALLRYDQVLQAQPDNYEALQGKAYVLYWSHRLGDARALFERLRTMNPLDAENTTTLAAIARSERAKRLAASEPPASSPPAGRIAYYQQRLQTNPDDADALEGLARAEAEIKQFSAAITAYRRVLASRSAGRGAHLQIARLLAWNHQYDESIRAYQSLLVGKPDDREALEGLARVEVWSGRLTEAAKSYSRLAAAHPAHTGYLFEAARLEAETHQYASARDRLTSLLAVEPDNLDARLVLAEVELKGGQWTSSVRQFERVLERRPDDAAALMGAAQARYYQSDLEPAFREASRLVREQPRNFDALFLMASIERARGRRHQARLLLERAGEVSPHNPEVADLNEKLWAESSAVLHVTAGYSREIGSPSTPTVPVQMIQEDLRSFTYGSTLDFTALPRTDSHFSLNYLPTEIPSTQGGGAATTPSEFLYRQATRVLPSLKLRAGLGLEHFGPGTLVFFPDLANAQGGTTSTPQPGATTTLIGFFGGTWAPSPHLSFDLDWSRLGITYTPLAVRLGVVSRRKQAGLNLTFDPRTEFHLTYFKERFTTERYQHLVNPGSTELAAVKTFDQVSGSGGTIAFNRRIISRDRLSVDAGYSGLVFGYDGPRRRVFLGFFTPSFYQRQLLTTRVAGGLSKRLGYDLSAGFGFQQVDQHQPLARALVLSPTLIFKATPYASASLGYTHYDAAQALGIVRGNGARVGIDWRF